ncbi:MAG: VOC family protein [Saprospiraceae bacterium]|nr:VOC family protein [Saprospiraceae bacterium]
MRNSAFHYAFQVTDIEETRHFYCNVLGCEEGRSTDTWIDFNFFGNQLSAHLGQQKDLDWIGKVDDKIVPIPHFGAVLDKHDFQSLASKLQANQIQFVIEPYLRFEGQAGAQWTMFIVDPSGNPLEFKAFENEENLFEK